MTYEEALNAARAGELPVDSEAWSLTSESGWPVAHKIAQEGLLPAGFNQWEIATCYGYTVAHAAACRGMLPTDYSNLDQADRYGRKIRDMLQSAPMEYRNQFMACAA